ncbi:hypothetical protein [Luteimonas terrae]|uniref:Inner membrane protein CbrB n=1 Tax=Luteimonas terrae TaxID=1530191 RepID=A0ABU1Y0K6_9GAMM|nr:hypothetical protein [Luteimonas terrae]MDR7194560.1 peptidoglycan/LPS O-acetylase OafA/YrhL [Luteimonas terrae]
MNTRMVKAAALFGVLGPVIGLLAITLPAMAHANAWSLVDLMQLLPAAYVMGAVPAAGTGAIVAMMCPRPRGSRSYLLAGLVGAACSAIYYVGLTASGIAKFGWIGVLFPVAGFAAGLVCGFLFLRRTASAARSSP